MRTSGTVRKLRLDPGAGTLDAVFADSGVVATARWGLTRPLRQLRAVPGSLLIVEGSVELDARGGLLFVEPAYVIVPERPAS